MYLGAVVQRFGALPSKPRGHFRPTNGRAKHAGKGHTQLDPGFHKQDALLGTTSGGHCRTQAASLFGNDAPPTARETPSPSPALSCVS